LYGAHQSVSEPDDLLVVLVHVPYISSL
jgi:hypothetical protein